jgi:hypothetical protein
MKSGPECSGQSLCRREAAERKVRTPTGSMLANGEARRRDGKCHREQTAWFVQVRVKGCGKSAPLLRRRRRHGKPHAEHGQIGVQDMGSPSRIASGWPSGGPDDCTRVGRKRLSATVVPDE